MKLRFTPRAVVDFVQNFGAALARISEVTSGLDPAVARLIRATIYALPTRVLSIVSQWRCELMRRIELAELALQFFRLCRGSSSYPAHIVRLGLEELRDRDRLARIERIINAAR